MEAKSLNDPDLNPDILDTKNTTDLPEEVRQQLSVKGRGRNKSEHRSMVEAVVSAAEGRHVSVEQIIVGLYRGFNVVEERKALLPKLSRYVKSGVLYRTDEDRYRFATAEEGEKARAEQREENRQRAERKRAKEANEVKEVIPPEPSPNEGNQDPPW